MKIFTLRRSVKTLILVGFALLISYPCYADTLGSIVDGQYNTIYSHPLESGFKEIEKDEFYEILPKFSAESFIKDTALNGGASYGAEEIFAGILRLFFREIYLSLKIMVQLVALALLSGILNSLKSSFQKENFSDAAFFACYLVLMGIAVSCFINIANYGTTAITDLVTFMQSLIPVVMTSLIANGAVTGAIVLQPALLSGAGLVVTVIKNTLLPLLFCGTAISMANHLSDKFNVGRLADLIFKSIKWSLITILTIFVGVVSARGFIAPVSDEIAAKTAKVAAGSFIPVIGSVISDSMDMIFGCAALIKNSVGIFGIVVVALIAAVPALKIGANITIFRLTCAIIEPVSDKRIVECLSDLASALSYLFAMLTAVALMFIFALGTVILISPAVR